MLNKQNKIHIVQIIPTLGFGGAERLVVDLANQLVEDNFTCSIITFFDNVPLASQLDKRVKLILVEKKKKLSFGLIKDLVNTLQSIGADIVHTHLFGADFWGSMAAKKLGLPVIATEHSLCKNESFLKNKLKHCNKKNIDKFVSVSEIVKQDLQKCLRIVKEKVVVINPGIDLSKFLSIPNKKVTGQINFLLLGRLEKEKNFALALEALSKHQDKNWHCRIVGKGSFTNDLKSLVDRLGMKDKIEFVSFTFDVVSEYNKTDVLLLPSLYEGFGLVALEAMTSARVIISTQVGILPEVIVDKKNGILCADNSLKSFTECLSWIFDNQEKLSKLGAEARKSVENKFSLVEMKNKYKQVYLNLLDKS